MSSQSCQVNVGNENKGLMLLLPYFVYNNSSICTFLDKLLFYVFVKYIIYVSFFSNFLYEFFKENKCFFLLEYQLEGISQLLKMKHIYLIKIHNIQVFEILVQFFKLNFEIQEN